MKKKSLVFLFLLFSITLLADEPEWVTVNVQAGSLAKAVKPNMKFYIEALRVVGSLNGTDVLFLREMMGSDKLGNATGKGKLHYLDLSQAHIVGGGDSYYRYNAGSKDYYTQNNIISDAMFIECPQLALIALPNDITEIGYSSFYDCKLLMRVLFPEGLKSIGQSAFNACSRLDEIELPQGLAKIGEDAFRETGIKKIKIPASVKKIEKQAFVFCKNLTSVEIEGNINTLGNSVFSGCTSLQRVELPNTIEIFGDGVFQDCGKLWRINIPTGLKSIGEGAFNNCSSLEKIEFPDAVNKIGEGAFNNCRALKEAHLPASLRKIPTYMFYGCTSLQKVNIPKSCVSIGQCAFYGCKSLTSIIVEAPIMPQILMNCFTNANSGCLVEVPSGRASAYKSDRNWSYFKFYKESDKQVYGLTTEELKAKAQKGDLESMFLLGACLATGEGGFNKNEIEGFNWLIKAARQNHTKSQAAVGECYHFGKGTSIDYKKAVYWYTKAANAGDAAAQCNLGRCYLGGQGVPKDRQKAIYWYRVANKNGSAVARQNLFELGIYE